MNKILAFVLALLASMSMAFAAPKPEKIASNVDKGDKSSIPVGKAAKDSKGTPSAAETKKTEDAGKKGAADARNLKADSGLESKDAKKKSGKDDKKADPGK